MLASYFVATDGNDGNPGTFAEPLASIQEAAQRMGPGDTAYIRAGTYRETVIPARSGTAGAPITFRPYNNESVVVSGADLLDSATWSVSDGSIYQAGMAWTLGDANQLFVDGLMQNQARWPNSSLDVSRPTLAEADSASYTRNGVNSTGTFNDAGLTAAADFFNGATITTALGPVWVMQQGTVTDSQPGRIVFSYSDMGATYVPRAGDPYYLTGKLNLLDIGGEWFRDPTSSTLYVWTPSGDSPSAHTVEAKARQFAFDLSNRSYICLEGLALFAATVTTSDTSHHIAIDRLDVRYPTHYSAISSGWGQGMDYTGVVLHGSYNRLTNSTIAFSAGNGITLVGDHHVVENNTIHDVDYMAGDPAAISAVGSTSNGHQILHNTLYNTGRSGLIHRTITQSQIEYNEIFNFGLQLADLGATYCYASDGQGTEIAYNLVHDGQNSGVGVGIYLDNGSSNYVVHHNVAWNIDRAMQINTPGNDHQVYNNTLVGDNYSLSAWPYPGDHSGTIIKNNIFTTATQIDSSATVGSNLTSASDPRFVDAAGGNYQLQSTSPARDAGQVVPPYTDGYLDAAPDRGAYEYGAPAWTIGAVPDPPRAPSGSPTVLLPEADATLRDGSYTAVNYGTSNTLDVNYGTPGNNRETLLRFDLSAITEPVLSAMLRLVPVAAGASAFHGLWPVVTDTWGESAVTWSNRPGWATEYASWRPVAGQAVEIDLSSLVDYALASDGELSLRITSEYDVGTAGLVQYGSREAAAGLQPQLILITPSTLSNAGPSLSAFANLAIDEDTPSATIAFSLADSETPVNRLTLSVVSSDPTLVPGENLVVAGTGANRTLTITPEPNQNGVATISVSVADELGGEETRELQLDVRAVNDPPALLGGPLETTSIVDGQLSSLRLAGIDFSPGGALDESSQALTITVTAIPDAERGSIVRAGDLLPIGVGDTLTAEEFRGLRFNPAGGSSVTETFSFAVADNGTSGGLADPRLASFSVNLELVRRLPISIGADLEGVLSSSDPSSFADLDGIAFFAAYDSVHGNELWRSDGTPAGTWLVRDIWPGSQGSAIGALAVFSGRLYFSANDGTSGTELWTSDGTAQGTRLVRDLQTALGNASPGNFTVFNGGLYFSASSNATGNELWRYTEDGGVALVRDIYPGFAGAAPARLAVAGSTLYFTANDGSTGVELWRSDGTTSGTSQVADLTAGASGSTFGQMVAVGSTLLFPVTDATNGTELWRSDGTAAGTGLLLDINPGAANASPANFAVLGSKLLFAANEPTAGTELWQTDGTTVGTSRLADIYPGATSSSPGVLTVVGAKVMFRAADNTGGAELWASDGTPSGTQRVKDIYAGTSGSSPTNLVNVAGIAMFTASAPGYGSELWRSDSTSGGTQLVADINPGGSGGYYANLAVAGGRLFFRGSSSSYDREPWTSDGTAAGTLRLKDIAQGTAGSNPSAIVEMGGQLYFTATTAANGMELWHSDGTAANTAILKEIGTGGAGSGIVNLRSTGNRLYFGASHGTNGTEPWVSDGSTDGTYLLADINPGSNSSSPVNFLAAGSLVYFMANDGQHGSELWRTDGTPAATALVADLTPGAAGSTVGNMAPLGNLLLFTFNDSVNGTELWRTDGTAAGTYLVTDIYPGASGSSPSSLVTWGGYVYFAANNGVNGAELWRSDGTAARTTMVKDIYADSAGSSPSGLTVFQNQLFFRAANLYGAELWKSNGTSAGTLLVKDIIHGGTASAPANFAVAGDLLFFTATTRASGIELWKTDGTSAGTALVADIRPGASSSAIAGPTALGNRLVFRADDGVHGPELWTSDGTTAGTRLLADLVPGAFDSYPQNLAVLDERLVFRATDGLGGDELWTWSDQSPTVSPLADVVTPVAFASSAVVLWPTFDDDVDLDAGLHFAIVANSNPTLVSTLIDAQTGTLTLHYQDNQSGAADVTIRATDRLGQSQENTFHVARVSLDADGNGQADALTDGILILRYLFDPAGQWNFNDALGSGATRTGREAIKTFLDDAQATALDVDGNGSADALTDGILILRYLFDPTGQWTYNDALGAGAMRTERPAIRSHLDQLNPDAVLAAGVAALAAIENLEPPLAPATADPSDAASTPTVDTSGELAVPAIAALVPTGTHADQPGDQLTDMVSVADLHSGSESPSVDRVLRRWPTSLAYHARSGRLAAWRGSISHPDLFGATDQLLGEDRFEWLLAGFEDP